MARLTVSEDADHDLDSLYRQGVMAFGFTQADQYINGLLDTLDLIAAFPGVARLRSELTPQIRAYPHRSHMIFYDVDDGGNVVIVRIRHAHEDWAATTRSGSD